MGRLLCRGHRLREVDDDVAVRACAGPYVADVGAHSPQPSERPLPKRRRLNKMPWGNYGPVASLTDREARVSVDPRTPSPTEATDDDQDPVTADEAELYEHMTRASPPLEPQAKRFRGAAAMSTSPLLLFPGDRPPATLGPTAESPSEVTPNRCVRARAATDDSVGAA